jgi:myo-inositol 2-dehydrogenase / D-chiro-inositol 1-dehydrogenase
MSVVPQTRLPQASTQPIRVGVVGLGRMGMIHALHIHELALETGICQLAAVSSLDSDRKDAVLALTGTSIPFFDTIDALAESRLCDVAVIVTNTELHREHALKMIQAGHRIFLEKPLTGTLEGDREFAAQLEREHPHAVMLGFQRRFDAPIRFVKQLVEEDAIGRVFKVYSALEDSSPAPNGFRSTGILPDMGIHNVDEILWLLGRKPRSALVIGSRIYSHRHTTCQEDFDDALMLLDFGDELIAQIQVGRNHVSGYRGETVIYGERGQISIGRFNQKLLEVVVEAYGTRDASRPIAYETFQMRRYDQPLPEFIDRFGAAYKEELRIFLQCCRAGNPFPITHRDALRAQEVIAGGMNTVIRSEDMAAIGYMDLGQEE